MTFHDAQLLPTHHDSDVDLDVLWATMTDGFPPLLDELPDERPRPDADPLSVRLRPICARTPASAWITADASRPPTERSPASFLPIPHTD